MVAEDTLTILRRYKARLLEEGLPIQGLVLYGSHARGEARPDSDIDVLAIFDDSVSPNELHRLWTRIDCLTVGIDTRIETWPVTARRFATDEGSPLLEIVRQEGVPV